MNNKIFITGVCGFIGYSVSEYYLKKGYKILGIDNLNSYYPIKYKKLRLKNLLKYKNFKFIKIDLNNRAKISPIFKKNKINSVFHFAAQAGVRYSQVEPKEYFKCNIKGFINLLDECEKNKIKKIMYASSSSVYGEQKKYPVKENFKLNPKNIYAKTKYLNEVIAEFYSKRRRVKIVGLRLFTVYGEWGRPDMLLFKIFKSFFSKKEFYLNNNGNHYRDFTYIQDVLKMIDLINKKKLPYNHNIFNICSKSTIYVKSLINEINKIIYIRFKKVKRNPLDVYKTNGENNKFIKNIKKIHFTKIKSVLPQLIEWYKNNKIYKYH
ncbi:MAG: NAD-dependent epimerase/dehydratase family protein [Candidatus Pelagibacter sp. TMED118]|nr:MAG: NAD-dependent epimerase/dehydratase family protein [Candidatus Pelagibacter sp. TMED118]|tara:strand:- start:2758 stop:3723 length:966 start_codon:yes stop_codon:yes gene_type:complete